MSGQPVVDVGARLERGKAREENQDHVGRAEAPIGRILVVADGVGGGPGGRRASQEAVEQVLAPLLAAAPGEDPKRAIAFAIRGANQKIHQLGQNTSLAGMASTVVVAVIRGWQCWIGHVGDSRAYLLRQQQLRQLTRDHSVAGSHVLTRGVGAKPDVEPEISGPIGLRPRDTLLLCSDGLWSAVAADEIAAVMNSAFTSQSCVEALTDLALEAGGSDNISLQCMRLEAPVAAPSFPRFGRIAAGVVTAALACGLSWHIARGSVEDAVDAPAAPTGERIVLAPAAKAPRVALVVPPWGAPDWFDRARGERTKAGTGCVRLLSTTPAFYYRAGALDQATAMRKELAMADKAQLLPMTDAAQSCSGSNYDIVVTPAAWN